MDLMHQLADCILEAFSERGHKIEKAVQSDRAFRRTRRPQSSMGRELVLSTIDERATGLGLGRIPVVGGGCDVQCLVEEDHTDRRFRVLKADPDPETGGYDILCTSESIMTISDAEPDSLYRHERWVMAYTVDDTGMIVDIFAARVDGLTDDRVPRLRLGPITPLGTATAPIDPNTGFQPDDEDDFGVSFDDDEDDTAEGEIGQAM
ncbi:hypothetical protein FB459_1140 [Yimella lutea]|uniref:Uncharacterized protein n=1 Tax=Yimella lutea TaxID=587872 RepID=A0A542EEH7_9MICO|nr:hypothetical protein [Yimella lutea]TQJ13714.1 hypothetical protein FB459_1140 [Yimella lutea]